MRSEKINPCSERSHCDVVIAGAGITGLALATALKATLGAELAVTVCAPDLTELRPSGRAYAITAGPRRMLEALQVWPTIAAQSQPIHEMIVTDSRTNDVVRPVFLNFSGDLIPGEPFAHMVSGDTLRTALDRKCRDLGVDYSAAGVIASHPSKSRLDLSLTDGRSLLTRLLIAADGGRSRLREQAGISTIGWDYHQSGIVVTLAHERDHGGRAEEHFLPAGPFAILPLCDNQGRGVRSSIVWTEETRAARRLVALDARSFLRELERRFGHRLGPIEVIDLPQVFPLHLQIARQFIGPRLALVGDAAHLVHPIAGQGLNLGLRDVAAIAELIAGQVRLGLDIGAAALLERYQRARRFDCVAMAVMTDQLNRLFSNDAGLIRLVRDFGLSVVERIPDLKSLLISEAAGTKQAHGRLLRGEPI
jgi:2-octaprenyl-6-methoxyphenol hydroxylase